MPKMIEAADELYSEAKRNEEAAKFQGVAAIFHEAQANRRG